MESMFENALNFNQNLNTNVMFQGTENEHVAWNTSNITTMKAMFRNAESHSPINSFDLSKVESMESMFENALNFNQNLNSNVMFQGTENEYVAWNTSNITTMKAMFKNAESFNSTINTLNLSKVESMESIFENALNFNKNLHKMNVSRNRNEYVAWNTSNITTMKAMFKNESFNSTINTLNLSKVESMESMFENALNFNQNLHINTIFQGTENEYVAWNTSNITTMKAMFKYATSFDSSINTFDLSKVESMESMFESALNFNQNLNTNVMFQETENEYIAWDTSNVKTMRRMFYSCSLFDESISLWNLSSVTNYQEMFSYTSFSFDIRFLPVNENLLNNNSIIAKNSNNTNLSITNDPFYNMFYENVMNNDLNIIGVNVVYVPGEFVDQSGNFTYNNNSKNVTDVTSIDSTPLNLYFSPELPPPILQDIVGDLIEFLNISLDTQIFPLLQDMTVVSIKIIIVGESNVINTIVYDNSQFNL